MTLNNHALLFCRLNRLIESLPVENLRGHVTRKFAFAIVPTDEGDYRVYGSFISGFAPNAPKQNYALSLDVDRFGIGSVVLPGWTFGAQDHALAFLSVLNFLEDVGVLRYGVWDAARSLNREHVDAYDSLARMAEIDLRDINANSFRELN